MQSFPLLIDVHNSPCPGCGGRWLVICAIKPYDIEPIALVCEDEYNKPSIAMKTITKAYFHRRDLNRLIEASQ